MNIVSDYISSGLNFWKSLGAKVELLSNGSLKVPKITYGEGNTYVVIESGLHLEETSGPILLLSPEKIKKMISLTNSSLVIYPVVNQHGLSFSENDSEKLLRYNQKGINYNDKWGMDEDKCGEVKLVEEDILKIKGSITLAFSLHEDSETPKKGYIYMDKIEKEKRAEIIRAIKSMVDNSILSTEIDLLEAGEDEFQGGTIEDGFSIVDSVDIGSFETWMSNELNIPTILSEAPFGVDLEERENFHLAVLKSAFSILS